MSTAFVAGATGYTGREVVRALVARRVTTIAHVRSDSPELTAVTRELEADGALVDSTPWEETLLVGALTRHRPDVVFALLGTTRARARAAREAGARVESYESVDYGLSAMLLGAAVASGAGPRFVYLSALGAGRPSGNAYFAARYKMERELERSGLPYVVARPSFITGPDRAERGEARTGERVAAAVIDGALGFARRLGVRAPYDRFGSMTAKELARALVVLGLDSHEPVCVAEPERLRTVGA